jgi:hypothetical protein
MLIYEILNDTCLCYTNYNVIKYMGMCVFLFQIIIPWYLLNKTVPKTSNTSILNKMVFLFKTSIIIGYFRQFDKCFCDL